MAASQWVQWLILVAVGVLFAANITIIILHLAKRSLRAIWLTALAGASLAWPLVVAARIGIPYQLVIIPWQTTLGLSQVGGDGLISTGGMFTSSPLILLDSISWSYGLALSTLVVSVLITAVSRLPGIGWRAWSGSLALAVVGLIAIIAGNPLTVMLAWAGLDLVEVLIWLVNVPENARRRNSVIIFGIRLLGLVVLLGATLLAYRNGVTLDLDAIPLDISPFLVLAAMIRLGVVPLQLPFHEETPIRQGLGTMLRLAPAAANLAFLSRMADGGVPDPVAPFFLITAISVALFSAFIWARAQDELSGRPYWLLSASSLVVVAVVMRQPGASLAWGVTSIITGGFIFLSSIRHRYLIPLTFWSVIGLTMLPFTPTWLNTMVYSSAWAEFPAWIALVMIAILSFVHALLLFGFMVHGLRIPQDRAEPERWIWLLYPPGLAGLLLVNFAWGWINQPSMGSLNLLNWLVGALVCFLTMALWYWHQRQPGFLSKRNESIMRQNSVWRRIFSFNWIGLLVERIYRAGIYIFNLLNATLEGEGGVLWALLLLIIFFSLVIQFGQAR